MITDYLSWLYDKQVEQIGEVLKPSAEVLQNIKEMKKGIGAIKFERNFSGYKEHPEIPFLIVIPDRLISVEQQCKAIGCKQPITPIQEKSVRDIPYVIFSILKEYDGMEGNSHGRFGMRPEEALAFTMFSLIKEDDNILLPDYLPRINIQTMDTTIFYFRAVFFPKSSKSGVYSYHSVAYKGSEYFGSEEINYWMKEGGKGKRK